MQEIVLIGGPDDGGCYCVHSPHSDFYVPRPGQPATLWPLPAQPEPTIVAVYRARRLDDRDQAGRVRMHFVTTTNY